MDTAKEKKKKVKTKDIEKIKNPEKFNKIKKKRVIIISTTFLILVILALFFSLFFAILQKNKNTFVKGVSARDIELSNLTIPDAKEKVINEINKELEIPLKLKYNDYSLDLNLSEFEFNYDIDSTLNEAYKIGRDDNILKSNFDILSTMVNGSNVDLKYSYNKDALNNIIENVSTSIPGKTIEYTYCIEEDELLITPGTDGIIVNKEELESTIIDSILGRNSYDGSNEFQVVTIPVKDKKADEINLEKIYEEIKCDPKDAELIEEPFQLIKDENGIDFAISMDEAKGLITGDKDEYSIPLKITKANRTVADLGPKAFPDTLSTFSTNYNAGAVARSKNLEIASRKINGTVVMPGEEFSFNKVVGKRTVEDGYQNAPVYENGKVVDGLAGGICQISSTLYNAVLLANLEITARRNHNFVSTYVPEGRDATVVYGSIDFKFKNSRKYPIILYSSVSGGVARFEIKGVKEDVEYNVKILTNILETYPFNEEIEEDATLAPGTKLVTQAGHNGLKVSSYRALYLDGKEISRKLLYTDTYKIMDRIVKVSTQQVEQPAQPDSPIVIEDLPTQTTKPNENSQETSANPQEPVKQPEQNNVDTNTTNNSNINPSPSTNQTPNGTQNQVQSTPSPTEQNANNSNVQENNDAISNITANEVTQ